MMMVSHGQAFLLLANVLDIIGRFPNNRTKFYSNEESYCDVTFKNWKYEIF